MELEQEVKKEMEECCPAFQSKKWEGKSHKWKNKKFIKASVPTLFYIPLPPMIGSKVSEMMKLAEDANKLSKTREDILLLFRDPSAFKTEIYLSVIDIIPNIENTVLNGTFMSSVFDGPFNAVPKFMKEMDSYLAKQDKKAKKYYVHYAYCPKCAKKVGHNFMVLFAEL